MRDSILEFLEGKYDALEAMSIFNEMNLKETSDLTILLEELEALVEEGIVFRTKKDKYILIKNMPGMKVGKYEANRKGFGFVILPNEEDLYIASDMSNGALSGDIVLCEVIKKGVKPEGRVNRIIKRDLSTLVGEVISTKKGLAIKLDDEKLDIELKFDDNALDKCVEGHKVLIKLDKQLGKKKYQASIKQVIGHKNDPGIDILSVALRYKIEPEFSEEVIEELKSIPSEVSEEELKGRKDLTNEMIFTIDGKDTKDIDDAISLDRDEDGNYILGVHIADVSNYVKPNTSLGDAAFERGTSNYLADTVIPMIPHQLSNGICSLNEGVIRLTMSCTMKINKAGKVIDYSIYPSYIKSCKKMNYSDVNNIIMRDIVAPGYEPFADKLKEMNELAHILRKEKMGRGYIDFNLDEAKIIQDSDGKAIDIVKYDREDGEKLIEDFMIAANETIASHFYNMDVPFIYRVHGKPNQEKIDDFVHLLKAMGYELKTPMHNITSLTMQAVLDELDEVPEFKVLSSMMLRSMKKAEYACDNIGHFGLASRAYTHFTSPIRRYPDLTVHRLIKTYLVDKDYSMSTIDYLSKQLVNVAIHSSEKEVNAQEAERAVDDMKMAEYMESHIGEEYDGIIDTVTNFGFFVELPNLVEGLVHISTIKGDYYNYVPEILSLVGNSTKKIYRIGDKVRVKCVAASKERAMIDFELVNTGDDKKHGNKKQKGVF